MILSVTHPDRCYIGSAKDFNDRWRRHRGELLKNTHFNSRLQFHYNKYGLSDLCFVVIEECVFCDNKESLIMREQYYLDAINPWFNICKVADSRMGVCVSPQTKEKMRDVNLGRKRGPLSPEHKANISRATKGKKRSPAFKERMREVNLGKKRGPRSEEVKRKISIANTGKHPSPETLEKLRVSHLGQRTWLGKSLSVEHKLNISKAKKGTILTAEHKRKIGDKSRGHRHTEQTKQKMRDKKLGHTVSLETRDKISKTLKSKGGN